LLIVVLRQIEAGRGDPLRSIASRGVGVVP
jgi:hypothetical protein